MHWMTRMRKSGLVGSACALALIAAGCGTFGTADKKESAEYAEVRQVPRTAEYTVFGPHRLRAVIAITGLPEGTSEENIEAARAGTYNGPVVWTLEGGFTFGTNAHRALEPKVTVGKSKPEQVEIVLTVVPPKEEVTGIIITRAPIRATFTASPQAQFRVRVVEDKK